MRHTGAKRRSTVSDPPHLVGRDTRIDRNGLASGDK
jgi:hypothetical protein